MMDRVDGGDDSGGRDEGRRCSHLFSFLYLLISLFLLTLLLFLFFFYFFLSISED